MLNQKPLTFRGFKPLSALIALVALLSACGVAQTSKTTLPPTDTPSSTNTHTPEIPPTLTATPLLDATATLITFPTATLTPCLARASFGDPADSPYILPYPVSKAYRVSQSYCKIRGGHSNQLAYDFDLSIGDDVTAARGGIVVAVKDNTPDTGTLKDYGQHNYIFIQHEDGTVAFYAHLKRNSIVVRLGHTVEAGQIIAASGNSGYTGPVPHLHFGVYQFYPTEEGFDVPVNFRNAQGPLDERRGLIVWRLYEALEVKNPPD